jgi:hypothetical protein
LEISSDIQQVEKGYTVALCYGILNTLQASHSGEHWMKALLSHHGAGEVIPGKPFPKRPA